MKLISAPRDEKNNIKTQSAKPKKKLINTFALIDVGINENKKEFRCRVVSPVVVDIKKPKIKQNIFLVKLMPESIVLFYIKAKITFTHI